MYSIGKFSFMTRLSVKTLRHYHELGLLVPDHIDEDSGYRYYRGPAVERARVIVQLRELGFGLQRIQAILKDSREDADIVEYLEERAVAIAAELKQLQTKRASIEQVLEFARHTREAQASGKVVEKDLPPFLFCGSRRRGRWDEIGETFGAVARRAGRHIAGPALSICYDGVYKEDGADYEGGFPVRRVIANAAKHSLDCRELFGARAATIVHRGPYSELGRSYEVLLRYMQERGYELHPPTREVYLKGPGMILRGNPAKYLTEIQIPLVSSETRKSA
ncbi:MAG: MerR family transcriptional regulator [Leptospirales bacterium]|jgi:DNA-binding transcriptional MerR regulator